MLFYLIGFSSINVMCKVKLMQIVRNDGGMRNTHMEEHVQGGDC